MITGASSAGGVCRNRDSEPISRFTCMLRSVPAASAIHSAATDHDEFITLVAGERPSLLMVRNDEVYDKPQRFAEDNVMQW